MEAETGECSLDGLTSLPKGFTGSLNGFEPLPADFGGIGGDEPPVRLREATAADPTAAPVAAPPTAAGASKVWLPKPGIVN